MIKLYFSLVEENTDSLTMLDLINLAEKMGFSIDREFFRELRLLRNSITHEYVENISEIKKALNNLKEILPRLEKIIYELKERVESISRD